MSREFMIDDYIDIEWDGKWRIGRIINKENNIYSVLLDGFLLKNPLRLQAGSERLAPFRKHTRGYTGKIETFRTERSDPKLELENIEEIQKIIQYIMKDYSQLDPFLLTLHLRGQIFLFVDSLLSRPRENLTLEEFKKIFKFLDFFLGFGVFYLRNYPQFIGYFNEGRKNPESLQKKNDVIYSHFIFELLESLYSIFGFSLRCSKFYENYSKSNDIEELKLIFSDSNPIIENIEFSQEQNSNENIKVQEENSTDKIDSEDLLAEKRKRIPGLLLLNKFSRMGGFEALQNIIFTETENNLITPDESMSEFITESESSPIKKHENAKIEEVDKNERENGEILKLEKTEENSEKINFFERTLNKGKSIKPLCPLLLIEEILRLFFQILLRVKKGSKAAIVFEIQAKITQRISLTRDKEIRELDIENIKKIFERLERIVEENATEYIEKFYEVKEKLELEFYFRFLDCQNFEKKLRGINGIREYASRIDNGQWKQDEIKASKDPLNYFTSQEFIKYLLEKKVIELIYEKYSHIELIKRSVDLLKFIAEFGEIFPENLIDIIWKSTKDKHEDDVKTIYEKIIELGPSLNIEAAQHMYSKFLTVKIEDYNEDFIDLICKFTKNCLRLVLNKTDNGFLQVQEIPENLKQHQFFGVPLMFELVMDHTLLDTSLSHQVLFRLQEIITEFPASSIFFPIVSRCLENIVKDRSVYQSLVIMKRFFTEFEQTQSHTPICEIYFTKITEEHPLIEHLVNDICAYCERVNERLKIRRKLIEKEGEEEEELKEESFVGKFSHVKNIFERLEALTYFIPHVYSKNSLTTEQVQRLWKVFVIEPNFTFETNKFLDIISKVYYVNKKTVVLVKVENLKEVLIEILCKEMTFITKNFTLEKFHCLEFFFLCVNLFEYKISIEQKDESTETTISSNYMSKIESDLTGLDFIWTCLVECPEGYLVDKFINLLVNIYTKLENKLKEQEHEKNQELIQYVMTEILRFLDQGNVKAIERYIQFLGKFFDRLENKRTVDYYRSFGNYSNVGQMYPLQSNIYKISSQIEYYPYGVKKQYEFLKKERVGAVKEILARLFEIDSSEFDMYIDGIKVTENELFKDLRDIYEGVPTYLKIRMIKRDPGANSHNPKYLLTQNREYVDTFFKLFSIIQPEKIKTVWDFVQKLPIQEDIKKEFLERKDFSELLDGDTSLSNSNIYKLYYYLSVIMNISVKDPYYLKTDIDLKLIKTDWANNFVVGFGISSLLNLITSTNFNQIDNFLFIKTLLLVYKVVSFFLTSFQESGAILPKEILVKNLDIILYSSQYIAQLQCELMLQNEIIRDHSLLCQNICDVTQKVLQIDLQLYKELLNYHYMKELLISLFINQKLESHQNYDGQSAFRSLLFEVLNILNQIPGEEKKESKLLLNLLFEEIIFLALKSQCASFVILRFFGELLYKFDLKRNFECDLNIFDIMTKLVQIMRSKDFATKNIFEIQIEVCYYIIFQFLETNQNKLQYFGQDLGLVEEILEIGVFQAPFLDRKQGPKYGNKNLIKKAFDVLSLLSRNEKNLISIINFLSPIHKRGIWRKKKKTSWNLSSNIKRRSYQYAGLKNLGCTCYMNSTLQQLYMIPTFRKYLPYLIDPNFNSKEVEDNVLFQLKRLFYGLTHIDKEYFSPKQFCQAFKDIDGSPTNPNEQKDASEFLSLFLDRIEEQIKDTPHSDFIKAHFGGLLSNELICKECPHHYEREEPLLAINLPVKNKKSILDSLESFIEGEVLDGDNAYYCEECKMKVKTVKRVSIKKLPNYLIFTLKRFEYDFDMNIRVKVNDYCEFPMELNMEPFTQQYLKRTERVRKNTSDSMGLEMNTNSRTISEKMNCEYNLKGLVVHLGIADSGHYYSLIKETRTEEMGNKKDIWMEFNDTKVCEFNPKGLGDVAFGEREGHSSYQSAFILVYEKKNINHDLKRCEEEFEIQEQQRLKIERLIKEQSNYNIKIESKEDDKMEEEKPKIKIENSEGEIAENRHLNKEQKWKEKDFYRSFKEEAQKLNEIKDELVMKNLRLFYITHIFSTDYSKFIANLIANNEQYEQQNEVMSIEKERFNIAEDNNKNIMEVEDSDGVKFGRKSRNKFDNLFDFVCSVYFTTIIRMSDIKMQHNFFEWLCEKMEKDMGKCEFVLNHFINRDFFTEMLFLCPYQEQRKFLINLVKRAFRCVFESDKQNNMFGQFNQEDYPISSSTNFLNFAINMLETSKLCFRTMDEYFWLFQLLIKIDQDILFYLLRCQFLGRLGSLFFNDNLEHEEIEELKEPLPVFESEIDLEYNEELRVEQKKVKESDLTKPNLCDRTTFFRLIWELLTWSVMPNVEDHNHFFYHKQGIRDEYILTPIEIKLFGLSKDQIEKMFSSISLENSKARNAICKCVAFSCYGSIANSKEAILYIQDELEDDKNNKRSAEYLKLIQVLVNLNDTWQDKRNATLMSTLVHNLESRVDSVYSTSNFAQFMIKLIKTNNSIANIFKNQPEKCDKTITLIRSCIAKQGLSNQSSKPANYQILEQKKNMLLKHIDFFENLKEDEDFSAGQNQESDSDFIEENKYKRGQKVEFFDQNLKKKVKGVVDNVYENIIKVQASLPNGNVYYDWIDDDCSDLTLLEEIAVQEINANPEDTSATQYCTSPGDISYRGSPASNHSFDEPLPNHSS